VHEVPDRRQGDGGEHQNDDDRNIHEFCSSG
jgi:hypothetical protein